METTQETLSRRTGGNENKLLVKGLAYFFMLIDHVGVVFLPQYFELRILGRIAMPLFAWGICVGAEYTRNIWVYALRMLIVGAISQPFFVYGMGHSWAELNVFATLLLGLLGIAAIREKRFGSQFWGPAAVILVACVFSMDYGWQGVAFVMLLYGARKNTSAIISLMIAYCLYWGGGTYGIREIFGLPVFRSVSWLPNGGKLISDVSRVQFWAILSLPIMILPLASRKDGFKVPKWVGYAIYPVHMAIFALIRHWSEIMALFGVK